MQVANDVGDLLVREHALEARHDAGAPLEDGGTDACIACRCAARETLAKKNAGEIRRIMLEAGQSSAVTAATMQSNQISSPGERLFF